MSVTSVVRLLSLVLATAALLVGAQIGSASNEPVATVATAETSTVQSNAWDGRLCPREVGYGKFDQPITAQDI